MRRCAEGRVSMTVEGGAVVNDHRQRIGKNILSILFPKPLALIAVEVTLLSL